MYQNAVLCGNGLSKCIKLTFQRSRLICFYADCDSLKRPCEAVGALTLANDKILAWSNLEAFADDKLNIA